jgi:hypothetical protein
VSPKSVLVIAGVWVMRSAGDGGRSLIRKAAGIEFPGWEPTTNWLIAVVLMAEEPSWDIRRDARGSHYLSRMGMGFR